MSNAEAAVTELTLTPEDLTELVEGGEPERIEAALDGLEPADVTLVLSRLGAGPRGRLLSMLDAEEAASLLQQLPAPQAIEAVEELPPATAARILEELPSDERADIVGELDESRAQPIIEQLSEPDAEEVQRLAAYGDDVAGGLMVTEYLQYPEDATIRDVIEDLGESAEEYADYDIQYAYVTSADGSLVGVLRMRDLLLSPRSRFLREVMIEGPLSVRDTDAVEHLSHFFDEHRFFGAPVVNEAGVLCGVVQQSAVETAMAEDSERMYRSAQGIVGGEELRTMPLLLRSRRRLSWLSVNIVLNIIAASVIALHQDTLEAVIALAVFLPIISDMSGCSGNQAVAVSMRELTLGVIRPSELRRTILAEVSVGLLNGLVLGILIGMVAILWKGDPDLGLVVGGALMLNTMVAVVIGGSVPLVLKRFGVDPALAAGPILTTITDMCGFFIVLTFASAMLSRLT